MKKAVLLASFFITTPILLIACVLYFSFLSFKNHSSSFSFTPTPTVAYAALPAVDTQMSTETIQNDSRIEIVRQFLHKYGSPLEPYAQNIVLAADKYDLDFRLVPAIGMQESNLCLKAPIGTNNCWGYGIYNGRRISFTDYPDAIEAVTKGLATYQSNGLVTPEEIMSRYTPSSNGSWARGVNQFMAELQ